MLINKTFLQWDSDFFGLNVESMYFDAGECSVPEIKHYLQESTADVIYLFAPNESSVCNTLIEAGAIQYANRELFGKNIHVIQLSLPDIVELHDKNKSFEPLKSLAYVSGKYSRFLKDPKFSSYYKRLYCCWLEKGLKNPDSNIFVINDGKDVVALLVASITRGIGKIDLLAVDAECRGRGYGGMLMHAAECWFAEEHLHSSEVVTQGNNLAAINLYKKQGYSLKDESLVFHYWK